MDTIRAHHAANQEPLLPLPSGPVLIVCDEVTSMARALRSDDAEYAVVDGGRVPWHTPKGGGALLLVRMGEIAWMGRVDVLDVLVDGTCRRVGCWWDVSTCGMFWWMGRVDVRDVLVDRC
jgi:hypothetical protein